MSLLLQRKTAPDPYDFLPDVATFDLSSADLIDGEMMPLSNAHSSAAGDNISPHLTWSGAPEGTKGYVVTVFDPDAPTPSGFWHWIVVDLPDTVTELVAGAGTSDNSLPSGFHVKGDFGLAEYAGAAPPKGDQQHRYIFVVHAVDLPSLGVDSSASPAVVCFNLAFHTLARARITVTFEH